MKVLVIGADGQLGGEFAAAWPDADLVRLTRADLDVTDEAAIGPILAEARPDVVVNTAAFHKVDVCEREPAASFLVNATAARSVARACETIGAACVFISTDYVFDGDAGRAYREADARRALNVYGASKIAGEDLVRTASERAYIIRSSGLYGLRGASGKGGNFVETILRRADATGRLQVVADQTLSPTATADLAAGIREVVRHAPPGVYHITNQGALSWWEFASLAVRLSGRADRTTVEPVQSADWDQSVRRPAYSVLENAAMASVGVPFLRPVDEALAEYLRMRGS